MKNRAAAEASAGTVAIGVMCLTRRRATVAIVGLVVLAVLPSGALASGHWKVQARFGTRSWRTLVDGTVSCASRRTCAAVGIAVNGSSAEVWDGSTWSARPFARVHDASLGSVSCTRSGCVAVGSYLARCSSVCPPDPFAPKGTHYQSRALVERLTGGSWVVQRAPSPGAGGSGLSGVSCTSATVCIAVGSWSGGPLVERYDGAGWTAETLVLPTGVTQAAGYNGAGLLTVSCQSSSACMAVGSYNIGFPPSVATLFAERWNGASWAFQPLPVTSNPEASPEVSCSSATACTIVGPRWHTVAQAGGQPFAERWNGASWSAEPSSFSPTSPILRPRSGPERCRHRAGADPRPEPSDN